MGWFTNSDDDNDDNRFPHGPKSFEKSFRSNANSVMKVCRMDPKDNNYMICKIKETKTQNINGEDVSHTEEREERVPVRYPSMGDFDPATRENIKSLTNRFVDDMFSFGNEMKAMEEHFKRTFNTFFGNGSFFFNDFFKEMDDTMSHFANSFDQNFTRMAPNQETHEPRHQDRYDYRGQQSANYNYQYKRNQKSDKDIYDV